MIDHIKHILVIRLSAMGDVAMLVPVIHSFRKQYPEIQITVLTRPFFKSLFRDINNVSVIEADVKGKHKGISGLYKLSRELKALKFDAVADCHNVIRSILLKVFIRGVPFIRIDKGRKEKKALIKGHNFHQLKTTHQRYADVMASLGFTIDLTQPIFSKPQQMPLKCNELIGDYTSLLGIAPFAAFQSKSYPLDLMEEVIRELSKENTIVLFGGGEKEIIELNNLEAKYDKVINLAGKVSFEDELDVISNLDVMISMDSGNGHLAAMFGIETVTLWGVTHPFAGFYPFHQDSNNALMADRDKFPLIPTSVYGKTFPKGYEKAIGTITPQTIIAKVRSVINKI